MKKQILLMSITMLGLLTFAGCGKEKESNDVVLGDINIEDESYGDVVDNGEDFYSDDNDYQIIKPEDENLYNNESSNSSRTTEETTEENSKETTSKEEDNSSESVSETKEDSKNTESKETTKETETTELTVAEKLVDVEKLDALDSEKMYNWYLANINKLTPDNENYTEIRELYYKYINDRIEKDTALVDYIIANQRKNEFTTEFYESITEEDYYTVPYDELGETKSSDETESKEE